MSISTHVTPGGTSRTQIKFFGKKLKVPPTYTLAWSGQFEAMQRVAARLKFAVPLTLGIIVSLIYLSTRSLIKTSIVLLAVPFSAIGAIWLLYLLHYNLSVAVWVGLIGLLSIDAETGVFMLLYLDLAWLDAKRKRPAQLYRGSTSRHPQRRSQASATQIHDVRHHLHRAVPNPVVDRSWLRRDEAYCRADGRWHLYILSARTDRLSHNLLGMAEQITHTSVR